MGRVEGRKPGEKEERERAGGGRDGASESQMQCSQSVSHVWRGGGVHVSQCSAVQCSEAQFGSVQVHLSAGSGSGSGFGSGSVQTTRDQHHSDPAQPSPAPARRRRRETGDEGRGRGYCGRRPGAQGCKEVERWLLLDAVIISRQRQGPGLTGHVSRRIPPGRWARHSGNAGGSDELTG